MKIKYLAHNDIDFTRWDNCIDLAINGNISAYSWYLNSISGSNWDALISDDYTTVMPLPYVWHFGKRYMLQPELTLPLGIFSQKIVSSDLSLLFLNSIPEDFILLDIKLNKLVKAEESSDFIIKYGKCYELDLIKNYVSLQKNYSSYIQELSKRAEYKGISVISGLQAIDLLKLYALTPKYSLYPLSTKHIQSLRLLMNHLLKVGTGEIIGVYDEQNYLCTSAFFIASHNKLNLLFYSQNKKSFKEKWIYLVFDYFIKKYAEKNFTLSVMDNSKLHKTIDLKLFGAQVTEFPEIYKNDLPLYLKIIFPIYSKLIF